MTYSQEPNPDPIGRPLGDQNTATRGREALTV